MSVPVFGPGPNWNDLCCLHHLHGEILGSSGLDQEPVRLINFLVCLGLFRIISSYIILFNLLAEQPHSH